MVRAIWKYDLDVADQRVAIPEGAEILQVQMQRGVITLWAIVDPHAPKTPRRFRIIGTGQGFDPTGLDYLGTVQVGLLVWHVFEVQP